MDIGLLDTRVMKKAILDGKVVIPCDDMMEWGKWFESAKRHVADDHIGDVRISTVFLGIDLSFHEKRLWFETMIFGGEHDYFQERYSTWDEAEAGHLRALDMVRAHE